MAYGMMACITPPYSLQRLDSMRADLRAYHCRAISKAVSSDAMPLRSRRTCYYADPRLTPRRCAYHRTVPYFTAVSTLKWKSRCVERWVGFFPLPTHPVRVENHESALLAVSGRSAAGAAPTPPVHSQPP